MKKLLAVGIFAAVFSLSIINFVHPYVGETSPTLRGPIDSPRLLWKAEPVKGTFRQPPLLDQGRIIAPALTDDGILVNSFDARTGRLLWSHELEGFDVAHTQISDGLVFVATNMQDTEPRRYWSRLTVLDIISGEVQWVKDDISNSIYHYGSANPINALDGLVYLAYEDKSVGAVDLQSGESIWREIYEAQVIVEYSKVKSEVGSTFSLSTVEDVLLITGTTGMVAVDRFSGQEIWSKDFNGSIAFPPLVEEGVVYFKGHIEHPLKMRTGGMALRGIVGAVDLETGEDLWTLERNNVGRGSPVLFDGVLVVRSNELLWSWGRCRDCGILGVDANTGQIKWMVEPWATDYKFTGTAVAIAAEYRKWGAAVKLVDIQTGEDVWRTNLNPKEVSRLVVSDEAVYFTTGEGDNSFGSVAALDLVDGEVLWHWPAFEGVENVDIMTMDPLISDGTLYVAGEHTIYALR